ncbi:hypothetical protein U1Q18_005219 [Sarracenia purpurea var. burkii]
MPEVKRLRDDLFANLDDSDLGTTCPDLDSFMKSFEEEISTLPHPAALVDLTSKSGESQPDLGFLLEASDDELGIPSSTTTPSREGWINEEMWRFDDQIATYGSFDFEPVGDEDNNNDNNNSEYVTLNELFDY